MGGRDAACPADRLGGPSRRVVLFGDTAGLPQLLRMHALSGVQSLVAAAIRPGQHEELAALAKTHALPLLLQPKPGDAGYGAFVARLRDLAPDLLIVNSYAMILRSDVLAIPRFGAVNVHGALLPAYRGANPTEWALINGERETGVTIHVMDDGIDTGPIIAQRKVPVRFADTWLDVRHRVMAAADDLLAETLPAILAGGVTLSPQAPAAGRSWRRRRAEDGRFAWSQPAIDIYNLVRALVEPHPGASVDGEVIARRLSLSEILCRKREAGHGVWTSDGWGLAPRLTADEALAFDVRGPSGAAGTCEILGIEDGGAPVTVRLSLRDPVDDAGVPALRALVTRLVNSELRREVR